MWAGVLRGGRPATQHIELVARVGGSAGENAAPVHNLGELDASV